MKSSPKAKAAFISLLFATIASPSIANAQVTGTLCNNLISPNAPTQPSAHYVGDVITLAVDRASIFNFLYASTNTSLGQGFSRSVTAPGPGVATLAAQTIPGSTWGNCELTTNILLDIDAQISSITGSRFTVTSLSFNGSSSGGAGGNSYLWSFGDGGTSTALNPTHSYNSAGSFAVQFTVTDRFGRSDTESQTLTIVDNPNVPGTPSGLNSQYLGCSYGIANYYLYWWPTGPQPSSYFAYEFKPRGTSTWLPVQWLTTANKTESVNGGGSNGVRVRGCLSASESTCGPSTEITFNSTTCQGGGGDPL